jgi:hypothetical protein
MLWKGEDSKRRGGGCFVFMYDVVRCAVQGAQPLCRKGRTHELARGLREWSGYDMTTATKTF